MIGHFHLPRSGLIQPEVFHAGMSTASTGWVKWRRNPNASKIAIFALAGGGGGGNGVVGANSAAAGGGGGGSSGQVYLELSAYSIPELLFLSVGFGGTTATSGIGTRVAVFPDTTPANTLVFVNGGGAGGNGLTGTGGTAGAAGAVSGFSNMPLAGSGTPLFTAGQAGTAGSITGAPTNISLPTTGLRCTGGAGGAGLGAAGAAGSAGGSIVGSGQIPGLGGGSGGSAAVIPPGNGDNGFRVNLGRNGFFLGGGGGGSTHGTALTVGLVGARGGLGSIGGGGGGGGGALTGSTQGTGSSGGDGLVIIFQW